MSGEQINLLADANTQQSSDASKDGRKRIADQVDISTAQSTKVNAGGQATLGGGIALISGGDQTYQAATLSSKNGTAIVSGGTVNFDSYRWGMLDMHVFRMLHEVREHTERWLADYKREIPHDSLGGLTPAEFRIQNDPAASNYSWH